MECHSIALQLTLICPCNNCLSKVESVLNEFDGVNGFEIDTNTYKLVVEVEDYVCPRELVAEINKLKKAKAELWGAQKGLQNNQAQLNNKFGNKAIGESSKGNGKGRKTVTNDLPAEGNDGDGDELDHAGDKKQSGKEIIGSKKKGGLIRWLKRSISKKRGSAHSESKHYEEREKKRRDGDDNGHGEGDNDDDSDEDSDGTLDLHHNDDGYEGDSDSTLDLDRDEDDTKDLGQKAELDHKGPMDCSCVNATYSPNYNAYACSSYNTAYNMHAYPNYNQDYNTHGYSGYNPTYNTNAYSGYNPAHMYANSHPPTGNMSSHPGQYDTFFSEEDPNSCTIM